MIRLVWRRPLSWWLGLGLVCLLATGCAKRIPLPKHLEVANVVALKERLRAAGVLADAFVAELRLTYFGDEGRLRATASLATQRPASLRYELQGPHGGVLQALATNGVELQFADLRANHFLYGRATPAVLDQLLGLGPLGLTAEAWVGLLFGELLLPDVAEMRYDDRRGRFVVWWSHAANIHFVEIEPATARITGARVERQGEPVSSVEIAERDERGLPVKMRLRVYAPPSDVEIRLREVDYSVKLGESTFHLDPPRGAVLRRVEETP